MLDAYIMAKVSSSVDTLYIHIHITIRGLSAMPVYTAFLTTLYAPRSHVSESISRKADAQTVTSKAIFKNAENFDSSHPPLVTV
jgi:hypothetical protein